MTRRQIDAGREVRLWITQVVIPALGVAMMFPEVREAVVNKVQEVKEKITQKTHK